MNLVARNEQQRLAQLSHDRQLPSQSDESDINDYLDTAEVRQRMAEAAAEIFGEYLTGSRDAYATQKCGRQFNELADKIESAYLASLEAARNVEADNYAQLRECAA